MRAELPLTDLEAFRLASFGLEDVPTYARIVCDYDCSKSRIVCDYALTERLYADGSGLIPANTTPDEDNWINDEDW